MPVYRSSDWSRRLDDPGDPLAVLEQQRATIRAATTAAAAEPIDVAEFVRAALDGAIGDLEIPRIYALAPFTEHRMDGFTEAQFPVYEQLERILIGRARRPLNSTERNRLGLALCIEWNRRARAEAHETRHRRSDWLVDHQASLGVDYREDAADD